MYKTPLDIAHNACARKRELLQAVASELSEIKKCAEMSSQQTVIDRLNSLIQRVEEENG